MHRWVVLLALLACTPSAPAGDVDDAAAVTWLYAPAPGAFPLGAVTGRLGRSEAPQPLVELGVADGAGGERRAALQQPSVWAVPGDGAARAVVHGFDGDRSAIELIDVDGGRVLWRDTESCAGPVMGVTREVIVCADRDGTRAVALDGQLRWTTALPFIALTGDRIVVGAVPLPIVAPRSVSELETATGDELSRIVLPVGVAQDAIVASCGQRELLALANGRLTRIADVKGAPAPTWAVPVGAGVVDSCDREVIVLSDAGPAGRALVAITRETGRVVGRIERVNGWWPARDGSDRIEVATANGVASYSLDLAGAAVVDLPPVGELIAARGERRLLRASPLTAVLLDRDGVRGYLALAATRAVLGEAALVAISGAGTPGETVRRLGLPPRWRGALRSPPRRGGVAVDAELRDLPPVVPLDLSRSVGQPETGMSAVTASVIDPDDGAALYAVAVDRIGERAAVVRADLSAGAWRWQRIDGCGAGTPLGLAVARDVVVCAASGGSSAPATLRATSRDGVARWEWTSDALDGVAAGGDVVVARAANRVTVLDAGSGRVRGHVASDDGAAVRVALVAGVPRTTLVITAERGRVVARLGSSFLPVWSIAVDGVVRGLTPSGAGVLVELEDGDAYRIDARTAAVVGLPGLGLAWDATADLVTGQTVGGPIPAPAPPAPRPTAAQLLQRPLQILRGEINTPPPMSIPITPPPPLGDSWQLTLYELTGGLRARNDYALVAPMAAPASGPAGSPLVVAYGPGMREVVVIDPRTGDPLRRVRLPDDAAPGTVFGTVVEGAPVAGTLLASPLRVVLF